MTSCPFKPVRVTTSERTDRGRGVSAPSPADGNTTKNADRVSTELISVRDRTFPAIPVTVTGYSLLVVTEDPIRYVTQETLPICRSFTACVTAVLVSELDRTASSVSGTSLSP